MGSNENSFENGDVNQGVVEDFAQITVDDDIIEGNNFGAGVYDKGEVYQQTERYKKTINAKSGIGQDIMKRARAEAWLKIAREGWLVNTGETISEFPSFEEALNQPGYTEFAREAKEKGEDLRDQQLIYGKLVYQDMGSGLRETFVYELSSLDGEFQPPEFSVAQFFNEASRSKGGRLMDNVFGRVKKMIQEATDLDSGGLFSRGD